MDEGQRNGPFWGPTVKTDLEAIAKELSLPEFDLLLIGDGSGTTTQESCGWACVAWNKIADTIDMHSGAMSCGTNNFAELIPYVQAMWHFDQSYRKIATPGVKGRIEIVSDSEVTVKCGNKEYTRKGNACLWGGVEWFENNGYAIHWTHVYRNTNVFSKKCDWFAGETRIAIDKNRKNLFSS